MANISISKQLSGVTIHSTATITEKSRSGTSVVLNLTLKTHLNDSGFIGTGYAVTGTVTAYGISKNVTLKSSSASWSGSAVHTTTTTMSITVPATVTSISLGYKVTFDGASASGTSTTLTLSKVLASVTSATAFSDTTNPTVYFSNPAKLKVRPYLNVYDKSGGTRLLQLYPPTSKISSTGAVLTTSYSWDLDAIHSGTKTYRDLIRDTLGAKTTAYVAVGVNTYSGTTYLGYSSKGVTFTNVLSPPTFTNFTFKNIDTKTLNLTGDNPQKFISGYSTMEITINDTDKAIANKGATMSHYLINGVKYTYSDDFIQLIEKWDKTSVEVFAVDSRGLTTQKVLPCELISYTPLQKGNIVAKRTGGVAEETQLLFEGSIWNNWFSGEENIGIQNQIKSAKYTYQIGTGDIIEGASNIIPTITENTFKFEDYIAGDLKEKGFDIEHPYNLVVTLEDELSSVEYTALVPSGIPALAIYKNNVAVHGKYDTELGGTQIYGDAYLNGKPLEITDRKILWQGGSYMNGTTTHSFSEPISSQKNGIVMMFSGYANGAPQNYNWSAFYIPKEAITLGFGGNGWFFPLGGTDGLYSYKYIYIKDTEMSGHANNTGTRTGQGVTYSNSSACLRYVIGV